jgi:predicted small lipoprotein YifL
MLRAFPCWTVLMSLLFVTGCGLDGPAPTESKPAPPVSQSAQDTGAKAKATSATAAVQPSGRAKASATSVAATDTKPGMIREQARVGMGEKGRGYGGGYIAVACASLWQVKERTALFKIEEAMKLYNGEHGYYPKTQEEFMKVIIKDNDIKLPVLPEGHKYEYDPKEGQLMVLVPQDPNGP